MVEQLDQLIQIEHASNIDLQLLNLTNATFLSSLNITNVTFSPSFNFTNATSPPTDDSILYITLGDRSFIISISVFVFVFLFVIFVSSFTGPSRLYFPNSDKSSFGLCWLYGPTTLWTPLYYIMSIRGSEYFLMYFWILKDFCWTQDYYYAGQIFGILAVVISGLLIFRSAIVGHYREVFVNTATCLWLMGNFWWMEGELDDFKFPNNPYYPVYAEHSMQANDILVAAACVLGVYYAIIRPFDLLKPSKTINDFYNEHGMESPFPLLFPLWRDYENFHIVVWLGKDIAWNGSFNNNNVNWNAMWNVFVIPTVLIGIHFVILTFTVKSMFIDHIHYISQFIWVSGNIVWAFGEMYHPTGFHDDAIDVTYLSSNDYFYLRWWAGWIFVTALLILAPLYLYWIPATYFGLIPDSLLSEEENDSFGAITKSTKLENDKNGNLYSVVVVDATEVVKSDDCIGIEGRVDEEDEEYKKVPFSITKIDSYKN